MFDGIEMHVKTLAKLVSVNISPHANWLSATNLIKLKTFPCNQQKQLHLQ